MGVEVLYGEYYANNLIDWLKLNGNDFDCIYLLRPHISIKYIDLVREHTNAKIVYNGVDFHFLRMQREYEITGDGLLLEHTEKIREVEFKLFEKADTVLTISDYEKEVFKMTFPEEKIQVIPTYIYDRDFPLSNNSFESRHGILFIGGFVHKPNYHGIKWFLENAWSRVKQCNPDMTFYIIGSNMPEDLQRMVGDDVIVKGYVKNNELDDLYNRIRLVIAPLKYGAGVKGKVIEGIVHGVPVVTTTIGAEGIKGAKSILSIKDDAEEFADSVINVHEDKDKWETYRSACIEYSRNNFSYNKAFEIIF